MYRPKLCCTVLGHLSSTAKSRGRGLGEAKFRLAEPSDGKGAEREVWRLVGSCSGDLVKYWAPFQGVTGIVE